jgi:ADP-sugar diphosphatase
MLTSFNSEIPLADHDKIINSPLFQKWLKQNQYQFVISALHFQSVDWAKYHGGDFPLFIKFNAEATDKTGKRVHGITLLRGGAVGILVVLVCEGIEYLLLVDQPRFPVNQRHFLEIPAGMMDKSDDPRSVALRELEEETGLVVRSEELIDMAECLFGQEHIGMINSPGLMDEWVRVYLYKKEVSKNFLMKFDGRQQKYIDEDEHICVRVLSRATAELSLCDAKSIYGLWLYNKYMDLNP